VFPNRSKIKFFAKKPDPSQVVAAAGASPTSEFSRTLGGLVPLAPSDKLRNGKNFL
jgi:hypothetical protein